MGTEVTQVLQGRFRTIDSPTIFLKIDTEDDKTRCAGSLFQNLTIRTVKAPRLRVRRLTVIGRCALVVWLGVGGGRIQTG